MEDIRYRTVIERYPKARVVIRIPTFRALYVKGLVWKTSVPKESYSIEDIYVFMPLRLYAKII